MRCIEIFMILGIWKTVQRLTLTWDVLKLVSFALPKLIVMININMRCIEIVVTMSVVTAFNRLTLTWDVLKFTQT